MKSVALLSRLGALCVAALCLTFALPGAQAQTPADPGAAKPLTPEQLTQAELLKSYLALRDQLYAAQLAIVNNRVESETAARVQTAAISEKLEAIKAAMATERERHQAEAQRLTAERQRQEMDTQRSMRTVLWVAAAFGGAGLLAILLAPYVQIRAMSRLVNSPAVRPQLAAPTRPELLAPDNALLGDQAVTQSSKRLQSVIERMEKRILELETTATSPVTSATTSTSTTAATTITPPPVSNGTTEAPRRSADANGQTAWIAVLMTKGRSLVTANKAQEAVSCYDEILKLDASHTEALVKKGAALERMTRDEEAIQCYDRAIKADGKMTLAYLYKGGVCNRLERYDEALRCYEQALQAEERIR